MNQRGTPSDRCAQARRRDAIARPRRQHRAAIEHEPSLIAACDRAVELGPKAGRHGGRVLFDGPPKELASRPDLPTGAAWQKHKQKPRQVRPIDKVLSLRGVTKTTCAMWMSTSRLACWWPSPVQADQAKSTLVEDVLYRAVARQLGDSSVDRPVRTQTSQRHRR